MLPNFRAKPEILLLSENIEQLITIKAAFNYEEYDCEVRLFNKADEAYEAYGLKSSEWEASKHSKPELIIVGTQNQAGPANGGDEFTGMDFLYCVKRHPTLKTTPTIVLNDSFDKNMLNECYQCNANACCVTPKTLSDARKFVTSVMTFWFESTFLGMNQAS